MRRSAKFHVDSAVRFWAIANIREGGVKRPPVKRGLTRALERGGGADFALPSYSLLIFFEVFVRPPWFFQYLPKNKRRTFWCKNGRLVDFVGSIFKPPKSALPFFAELMPWRGCPGAPPPPAPAGWASAAPAGRWRGRWGGGARRALGGEAAERMGRRRRT